MGSISKVINFLLGHVGEPIKDPRICNISGFCIAYEAVHNTHFGCKFKPLFIGLNFSLFCFVKTCSGERTIGFPKIGVCFNDIVNNSLIAGCFFLYGISFSVVTNFSKIAKAFFKNSGKLFRGDCKGHGVELVNSKLLFNVEDRAGVIEVEYDIGIGIGSGCFAIGINKGVDSCFNIVCPVVALCVYGYEWLLNLGLAFGFTGLLGLRVFRLFGVVAGSKRKYHYEGEKQCKKFFHNNTPYISFVFLHMFLNTMAGIVFRNYNTILYGYLSIILTVL